MMDKTIIVTPNKIIVCIISTGVPWDVHLQKSVHHAENRKQKTP